MNFGETMLHLRGSKFCTFEKSINKNNSKKKNNKKNENILMVIAMVILHIEPPLYTSSLRVFIALVMLVTCTNHGFEAMVFVHTVLHMAYTIHGFRTMVLCTRFSMVLSSIIL